LNSGLCACGSTTYATHVTPVIPLCLYATFSLTNYPLMHT
jgi:hypothetical protein